MIEASKDLAFRSKPAQDFFGISAASEELDSYLFFEVAIRARRLIDGAHSALPDFARNNIGADALANLRNVLARDSRRRKIRAVFQLIICVAKQRFGFGQEGLCFVKQSGVIRARPLDECRSRCR